MALIAQQYLTLLDHAKRMDPDGKHASIVEILAQNNPIIQDMPFVEGNLPTGHRVTVRTGLPDVYWRKMNEGVLTSKSKTAQVDEACGMLEAWSQVDKDLADLGGQPGVFRLNEATAFIEAMGQEFASAVFYGSTSDEFFGLSSRYAATSAANGQNIVKAGGASTDNSSIWLICWSPDKLFGIFPKGLPAGIQHFDHGEVTVDNAGGVTGAKLRAYEDRFAFKGGIVVKDWRWAVRVPNIDISNLTTESSAADLSKLMIRAMHRLPSLAGGGKMAFYMNRTVLQMLDTQRRGAVQTGGQLSYSEVDGKPVQSFRGIPVKVCDALLENESLVS